MAKTIKVDKEAFTQVLQRMIGTKPTPKANLPKSKKKLAHIIEPTR